MLLPNAAFTEYASTTAMHNQNKKFSPVISADGNQR
jgi:hypothetical protein